MTAPKGSYNRTEYDPVTGSTKDYGRFYAHPNVPNPQPDEDGPYQPRPSITNIIKMVDSDFLPGYYAKLVAEYAVENTEQISGVARRFGSPVAVGVLKAVVNKPHAAAAVGDEVHAAIDAWRKGTDIPELSTSTARGMFKQFLAFMDKHKPEIIASEYTVWSYKHGYAGSGDLLWMLDGKTWAVDTKTGTALHPKVALQLAAAAKADVMLLDDGTEVEMPRVDVLGGFHVRPRSAKLYTLGYPGEAFKAFLGALAVFNWQRFSKPDTVPAEPSHSTL
jgi:hypothetical protein